MFDMLWLQIRSFHDTCPPKQKKHSHGGFGALAWLHFLQRVSSSNQFCSGDNDLPCGAAAAAAGSPCLMTLTAEVDVVFSKPTSLKTHNLHFFFTQISHNDTTGEMQWCVCVWVVSVCSMLYGMGNHFCQLKWKKYIWRHEVCDRSHNSETEVNIYLMSLTFLTHSNRPMA